MNCERGGPGTPFICQTCVYKGFTGGMTAAVARKITEKLKILTARGHRDAIPARVAPLFEGKARATEEKDSAVEEDPEVR